MSDVSNVSASREQLSAMRAPTTSTFDRTDGSIRRTSHIDMTHTDRGLVLVGTARDLVTLGGDAQIAGQATLEALVGRDQRLLELTSKPRHDGLEQLLEVEVAAGFRDAVRRVMPDEVHDATPLSLLLDDLPVAALISGYARLYTGEISGSDSRHALKADICSGWRSNGTMMVALREHDSMPVPVGPPAPELEYEDDALGWHEIGPLGSGSMRRRRLVDVTRRRGGLVVQAMFRDTHVGVDGIESVLHEYSLVAELDASSLVITSCDAVPRVLPWVECPVAAASATRLVDSHVGEVRSLVRRDLRGTSTCTHLNDLLRSLGDVGALAAALDAHLHADRPPR
jgi:Protein of unknown function (DUF2889)